MERKTPLYDVHVEEGGKIVPFAGYLLPVQYGTGVIQEHMAVRQQAGLFDVSHMGEILFTGPTALDTINHLLTNDYNGMAVNKVRYGAMCNADGGTIDDLVVYKFGEERYLAVVNAANREKDYAHMAANVLPGTQCQDISDTVAQLALPFVESAGCSLWDVEYVKEAGEWFLRIYIDKEGGVSIEDCEAVSRPLSDKLDEADPIEGSYTFEVSSAGADRVLKKPEHFARFQGSEVEVRLYRARDGRKDFVGLLQSWQDGDVVLEVGGQPMSFEKKEVAQVRLYPRF